jgi:hypothetical protein
MIKVNGCYPVNIEIEVDGKDITSQPNSFSIHTRDSVSTIHFTISSVEAKDLVNKILTEISKYEESTTKITFVEPYDENPRPTVFSDGTVIKTIQQSPLWPGNEDMTWDEFNKKN